MDGFAIWFFQLSNPAQETNVIIVSKSAQGMYVTIYL